MPVTVHLHVNALHCKGCAAGTFGRVLECWDRKNKDYVAIKIVRNVQKYRDAAMIEVIHCFRPNTSP